MPLTKGNFRARVREMMGDPLRISGTATGGSLTTIVDTAKLTQADNYWAAKSWKVFVITTTDTLAPQGEAGPIMSSSSSAKSVTTELPFSAVVAANDTYGIALFSHAHVDNIIAGVLKEFSQYRPIKFTENLSVTANEKRFTPTSANVIRYVNKVEKYTPGVEETLYDFIWNANTRQVEFANYFSEAKTLTLHAARSHTLPSAEGDAMTYHDDDEDRLLRWCAARALTSMTLAEYRDGFGTLKPKTITRGPITTSYGDSHTQLLKYGEQAVAEIIKSFPSIKI